MNNSIVKVEHLSHRYTKDWAVKDLSFEIKENGILGLLGSNGAGKSTTMNILCGVLNQTEGKILINGINLREQPREAKKLIGFLPQNPPLHLDLTVDEYLTHCAYIRLIEKPQIKSAVENAKERCGIAHFSKRLLSNLSGGYKQRVGIAQAIIHAPKLVVLDEPTNGLDPNQITEVRSLIREIGKDKSVIFSSHILSEIQATCDSIKMIENGKMVFSDTTEAFNNYIMPNSVIIAMENPPSVNELAAIPGITDVTLLDKKRFRMHFSTSQQIAEIIIQMSVERDWRLREINFEKSSLDEIFAQLSGKVIKK